jgi:hypothetical protein
LALLASGQALWPSDAAQIPAEMIQIKAGATMQVIDRC